MLLMYHNVSHCQSDLALSLDIVILINAKTMSQIIMGTRIGLVFTPYLPVPVGRAIVSL